MTADFGKRVGKPPSVRGSPGGGKAAGQPSHSGTLTLLLTVLLSATLIVLISLGASWQREAYQARIAELEEENQAQQFHLQRFSQRLADIDRQMERLEDLQAKLKIVANLDLQASPGKALSAGGAYPEGPDRNAFLEMEDKRLTQKIQWELEELTLQASILERNAYRVEAFFELERSLISATPAIWPVEGWVSSPFGLRLSPFTGSLQMHEGMDIGGKPNAPVRATADGVVLYTGWKSESGKTVTLDHGYGYLTSYGHLSRIDCHNGQRVKRGEVIGALGNTGKSTGHHLHYEVKLNGLPVNPANYLMD